MKELPKSLQIKLLFYVTIIPACERLIFYGLILSGIILLLISVKRLVRKPKNLKPEEKFPPRRRKSLGYFEASVQTLMSVTTSLDGDFDGNNDKEMQENYESDEERKTFLA